MRTPDNKKTEGVTPNWNLKPEDIPSATQIKSEVFARGAYEEALGNTLITVARTQAVTLKKINDRLYETWRNRGTIYLLGNGGSYSVATHAGGDGPKRTRVEGMPFVRAISPFDTVPGATAYINDAGQENALAELLKAHNLGPLDTLICISGSGRSPNIINAAEYAKSCGVCVIGLTSQYSTETGGKLGEVADIALVMSREHLSDLGQGAVMAGSEDVAMGVMHGQWEILRERIIAASEVIYEAAPNK